MSEYRSIACIDHERLEFAVLRRQRLRLRFVDESGIEQDLTVLPTDVATRNGAEWLNYRVESGPEQVLRLDRILRFVPAEP
ncbi:MAG: transcriptional antiterminator, Rof [Betaproteobacteria bacterium]|nr:transcriptional antiterminator, Rof [Betaproteobacteria bacterium]